MASASVRITRVKMLKELKDSLKTHYENVKADNKAEEQYKIDCVDFNNKIIQAVIDGKLKVKDVNIHNSWKSEEAYASLDVTLPKSFKRPERANHKSLNSYELDDLKRQIKVVEMCEDEFLPQSLHKNLVKFLTV